MLNIDFSENVESKADGLIADNMVVTDSESEGIFWVMGSSEKPYRVQTDGETWVTCTCRHGQTKGGLPSCSHVSAVMKLYFLDCES